MKLRALHQKSMQFCKSCIYIYFLKTGAVLSKIMPNAFLLILLDIKILFRNSNASGNA